MFDKLKGIRDGMSQLSELKQKLESVDMTDPKSIANSFGIDYEELEKDFESQYHKTPEIEYVYKSVNPEPKYHYGSDSGFDLRANETVHLAPFERALVPTGLYINVPERCEVQIRPKSGLTLKKGLTVLNTPGTVDCFSEDMKVLTTHGEKTFNELKVGDVVLSLNEETMDIEKKDITELFDTGVQDILVIETEDGILEVTPNSEVYTTNGIVFAKDLTFEHEIITFS